MLFDFKSQKWSMLYKGLVRYPSWSHYGRFVYFLHLSKESAVLARVKITQHCDLVHGNALSQGRR